MIFIKSFQLEISDGDFWLLCFLREDVKSSSLYLLTFTKSYTTLSEDQLHSFFVFLCFFRFFPQV